LMNKYKILLISSGQPSLNPRLVKEADALTSAGYNVTVLYAYWNDWGTKFDKELISSKKWKAICVGGDPQEKPLTYFLSRLIHKLAKTINQLSGGKYWGELSIARAAWFLMSEAKKNKADLYIGHNLGALPATVKAAHANKKPCGFDAEDFHRFELSDDKKNRDVILKTSVENRYIPHVAYLTTSSPLIAEAYQRLYPVKRPVAILNVFPGNNNIQQPAIKPDGPLSLFWFSQTIGPQRGIENIINALLLLKNCPFELHLLGYASEEIKTIILEKLNNSQSITLHFHEPVPPDEIIVFASQFNLGLASESNFPLNRDICLTNKIFTYIQAGLGVLASDTKAQHKLLDKYPEIGKVYQNSDPQSLADTLLYYHQHREKLFELQITALSVAREKLNWETESQFFLTVIKGTLTNN
jgi:glycosyltransferase involved in cell wall biosynthesis